MAEPFVGEIRNFGFNYAPIGWALCEGQLLEVSQYDALFSLLGTTYGGDGINTFGLPDLRGRVSIHVGEGPGLTSYHLGQKAGVENVTMDYRSLPSHGHDLLATTAEADTDIPTDGALANARSNTYLNPNSPERLTTNLRSDSISVVGEGRAMENHQPYLVTNFCIALFGIYPSRT